MQVGRRWNVAQNAEITLEANPSSVEAGRFRGYRAAGVNRVSLGVQSLDDIQLKALGRLHNAAEAMTAIGLAREIFPRLSFDLIYARPGQTPAMWEAELEVGARSRCRPSVALPAHHRAGHAVLRPSGARPAESARSRCRCRSLRNDCRDYAPRPACRPMKSRTMQRPAQSAGTTSSTGATTTMPASAPAPMAA